MTDAEYYKDVFDDENGVYVLSPWGCLESTLREYGIDVSHVSGRVGTHIVEDFMEDMVRAGHVSKSEEKTVSRIEKTLHGLSSEEQYNILHWLMHEYAVEYTDSREAVIAWLGGTKGDKSE